MHKVINIFGNASKTLVQRIEVNHATDSEQNLMDFLRLHNIPIASSCLGEGVCEKCTIFLNQNKVLSCQVKLKDLKSDNIEISIDYL